MEIVIKDSWSKSLREENILNYIQMLGINLYKRCRESSNINSAMLNKISMNLCIVYAKSLIMPYIRNVEYGSFEINLEEKDVIKVAKLAQSLEDSRTAGI